MPIFPRYGGVSTNVSYDKALEAPSDPRPRQIQELGGAVEGAANTFAHIAQKRQALEDEAETQKRYMLAVTDMETATEQLSSPANAMQAKALFGKHLTEREPEWFKGLNGRQTDILKKKLFAKQLEYQVGAGKLENRAKLEDYNATMVRSQSMYAQKAARMTGPDDASATQEYQDYSRMVDLGVQVGYIKADKGEEMKKAALSQGAYARVYQTTASENRAEVQHVLDLYKQEKAQEGSTFLKHLDPKERIELEKQLQSRAHSLDSEAQRKKREAREDTEKMNAELTKSTTRLAAQKLTSPEKYGPLTSEWVDMASDLGLMDDKDVILFRREMETRASSGTPSGYNNPLAFQRYSVDVYDTRSPAQAAQVVSSLKADMAAGKITYQQGSIWLNHLEEKAKAGAENPEMRRASSDVKDWLKRDLVTSGPMQAIKDTERSVLSEAIKEIDLNEQRGFPRHPSDIYNEKVNDWMARAGISSRVRASEQRRSMGMPPTSDPKTMTETLEARRLKLQEQFKAAPPGPEGDELRAAYREAATRLRELQKLERSMSHQRELRQQSRQGKESQQSSGAPQLAPRR